MTKSSKYTASYKGDNKIREDFYIRLNVLIVSKPALCSFKNEKY